MEDILNALEEVYCDICGDYHDKDSVPMSCENGDGL
jgi:hypothetical protein